MQVIILVISAIVIISVLYASTRKKKPFAQPGFDTEKEILLQHVSFYKKMSAEEKIRFEQSVQHFLQTVRITGIKTTVEDIDSVLIAAAAIIPIFAFKNWEYRNIHEILLYPDSFDADYRIAGSGRDTLGMVGNGPMQNVMILSKQDVRNGFLSSTGKSNTALHEFVHLIDKADGDTDGLPGALLQHQYAVPWLKRMHQEIQLIRSGKSDINPYGATNEAEFLAVTAEYFFEQPHLMQQKHPELFSMLEQIFTPAAITT
ncbi:MAG: M90 family metallopeptidase [Bacteroidota bacterium]